MARHLNLRQIEAFKAVIENGTVSRAAELLNMSQPAMSRLIAYLELDTGLKLFDRIKGRLAPTEDAVRLHEEVGRIFAGVREVESAVEAIRREKQGRLSIGVIPALAGAFVNRAAALFRVDHPDVFLSVQTLTSQWIIERTIARKLDVGLIDAGTSNPYVHTEPLVPHPLMLVAAPDHPFAQKRTIDAADLHDECFVAFNSDTFIGHHVERVLDLADVHPKIVMVANTAPTICEFVAGGFGVALLHPLMMSGMEKRLVARPFAPEIPFNFEVCRSTDSRNAKLVEAFEHAVTSTAQTISEALGMGSL